MTIYITKASTNSFKTTNQILLEKQEYLKNNSLQPDNEIIYESIKNGAVGYILKSEALIVIRDSIHEAFQGGAPITAAIARKVLGFFQSMNHSEQKIHSLTPKESVIIKLLSKGYLYKEIADMENNSAETIKKHIGNIYRKLGVSNKTEAANIFLNHLTLNLT